MSKFETLAILDEIESLVSDQLQVVSYKWLSRNFFVSSNAAKRLLQEFVDTRGKELEVVYSLSGWLKSTRQSYHITLASGPKLEDAKQAFNGNCSIQVYSVQACIPKDPAALWNAEFVQAQELFKQPSTFDNCLWDNRFCGILNSFVKRHVDETSVSNNTASQSKSVELAEPSKTKSANTNITVQQIKVQKSSSVIDPHSSNVVKEEKLESDGTRGHVPAAKPHAERKTVPVLAANKKKIQSDKSSSGNGNSFVKLWGPASAKSKETDGEIDNAIPDPPVSAEAQIYAREALGDVSSDEDTKDASFKCVSNSGRNKRRVILDYSDDEYEDAVNLSSPSLPKEESSKILLSEKPDLVDKTEDNPKVIREESTGKMSEQILGGNSSVSAKSIISKTSVSDKIQCHATGDVKKDVTSITAPNLAKRRKVLKKSIDERGREVTEVVWDGEETETEKADENTTKKCESNTAADPVNNRAPVAKKSPVVTNKAPSIPGGKAVNKKGSSKYPKQGNIMSFFKKK